MLSDHERDRLRHLDSIPHEERSAAEQAEHAELVRKSVGYGVGFVSRDDNMPDDPLPAPPGSIGRDEQLP